MKSGNLSQYLGAWSDDFYGGPTVKKLEEKWCEVFKINHSISVNSNTSGLFAAIGAIGVKPGDEVIVTPYSMSASALAPLIYGGIPIFADIDPNNYCLDPKSIEEKITPRTKAILVVHLFGHPADMKSIMDIAKRHNLKVIEDCAQCPLGMHENRLLGTIGDIGIFSLNYHKHIHCGEGGVIVTNNPDLAERCQMIRNHAENIVGPKGIKDLTNLLGFNYRMTEINCAIAIAQLDKLPKLVEKRIENVQFIADKLEHFPAFDLLPEIEKGSINTYYFHPIKYNSKNAEGIHRNKFIEALKAEIPSAKLRETAPLISSGYVKPLYLLPVFQQKAAWAFNEKLYDRELDYSVGICPVTEQMHNDILFTHEYMRPSNSRKDMIDFVNAIDKIFSNISELK
tara:strand:- start:2329 stop:3519 length:1191 start_codon:yes stop_codon:yes gene_type:complete